MTKAEQKVAAPSFTKEDLIKNADALGYKSEVVAGALYGVKAVLKVRKTWQQMKKLLNK